MHSMSSVVGRRPLAAALLGRQLDSFHFSAEDLNGQPPTTEGRRLQAGFSLLEMLIVCALLMVIMGAIFGQIRAAQLSSTAEQTKLDLFQESREFMDQMSRDLRASGYPNTRNFQSNPANPNPEYDSPQEALGITKIDVGELQFESSVDGCGSATPGNPCNVSVIVYQLVTAGPNCPCLVRSQQPKASSPPGDPLTGQLPLQNQTEVQNVLNGTNTDPIFQAYDSNGTAVSLPIDISCDITSTCTNGQNLANVNSIQVRLKVQSPYPDPQTHQKPTMTLLSTVRLNNCSVAYPNTPGTQMGCK